MNRAGTIPPIQASNQIANAAALAALPHRTAVMDVHGKVWQKQSDGTWVGADSRNAAYDGEHVLLLAPLTVLAPAGAVVTTGGVEAVIDDLTASIGYGYLPTHERDAWATKVLEALALFDGGLGTCSDAQRQRAVEELVAVAGRTTGSLTDHENATFLVQVVTSALGHVDDQERWRAWLNAGTDVAAPHS